MISFIKGTVVSVADTSILLECNHMGFQITMPSSALFQLQEGMELTVHTHLAVREDDLSLFGFLSKEDLHMFRQLITVSGIGPKGAIAILSNISTEELRMAIAAGDAKLISSSKGIGLKTAQKLVVDLKGKFKDSLPASAAASAADPSRLETAILFVQSTGVSRAQCMKALSAAQIPQDADVDQIIDLIFRHMSTI